MQSVQCVILFGEASFNPLVLYTCEEALYMGNVLFGYHEVGVLKEILALQSSDQSF